MTATPAELAAAWAADTAAADSATIPATLAHAAAAAVLLAAALLAASAAVCRALETIWEMGRAAAAELAKEPGERFLLYIFTNVLASSIYRHKSYNEHGFERKNYKIPKSNAFEPICKKTVYDCTFTSVFYEIPRMRTTPLGLPIKTVATGDVATGQVQVALARHLRHQSLIDVHLEMR